jgi:probable addiction module antidote protein
MARTRVCAKGRNVAVAYLNVLIDDADEEELTAALGRIARASGGPKLVEKVELNAPSFYRTLCRRGNPELKSVAALLKAMGIRLALQPLGERKPMQHLRAGRSARPASYLEMRNRDAEDTAYYTAPEVDLIASPPRAQGKMTRKDGTPY